MPARTVAYLCVALALATTQAQAEAQTRNRNQDPPKAPAERQAPRAAEAIGEPVKPRPGAITSAITFADIGFGNGFRFANLGGRREFFVPLPEGADITATELVLTVDDVSAHDAKRSFEVLLNDRSVASIALDGKAQGRTVRIPLGHAKAREGFLKFSFLYSGAATPDRCIDVRYVGDSLTVRPETAVEIDIAFAGNPDVATTAALMPRDVVIVLPRRRLEPSEIAAALTVARALSASGRRSTFHHGFDGLPGLAKRDGERWMRGLVVVGPLQEVIGQLDSPVATVAGPTPTFGSLVAVRIAGLPALVVSDASAVRAGRLLGSQTLNATRGMSAATVGDVVVPKLPTGQVSFDRLGIVLPQADVFGRADLPVTIDTRALPAGTRATRVVLDVLVAPDGAGEKAVVSAFINERLVDSAVAATGDPTRLDFPLADGLVGTSASVRAVVQRRSAQGDCRFEPQGYPAQILGSSAVVLEPADAHARDFSDLVAHWANGVEVHIPPSVAEQPLTALPLLADLLNALAPDTAIITAKLLPPGTAPTPGAAFIAVSSVAPAASTPRVRFDRGRVAVADRSGQTLLDLGGFAAGAVVQVVNAG
ncbi:MAG: hypothetical protein QOG83_370, partial [Alphaproteobacteria bacterium]|nr:hypothetical protein [Alphaproteobacteria bacterium]